MLNYLNVYEKENYMDGCKDFKFENIQGSAKECVRAVCRGENEVLTTGVKKDKWLGSLRSPLRQRWPNG